MSQVIDFQTLGDTAARALGAALTVSNGRAMLRGETRSKIQALMQKYPERRSALIPSLILAQKDAGYLSAEVICEVAEIFQLTPSQIHEVASFYTMLFRKPVGKYVIWVCTNISCLLNNSEAIMNHLKGKLGIQPGETTPDGRFTLMETECLASCGTAPVVQINDDYHENLTAEKLDQILNSLK